MLGLGYDSLYNGVASLFSTAANSTAKKIVCDAAQNCVEVVTDANITSDGTMQMISDGMINMAQALVPEEIVSIKTVAEVLVASGAVYKMYGKFTNKNAATNEDKIDNTKNKSWLPTFSSLFKNPMTSHVAAVNVPEPEFLDKYKLINDFKNSSKVAGSIKSGIITRLNNNGQDIEKAYTRLREELGLPDDYRVPVKLEELAKLEKKFEECGLKPVNEYKKAATVENKPENKVVPK